MLDVCADIVDVEGFPSVTIDRVATTCGVSRTVVYQLFGGLDGMLDALVQRSTERAAAAIDAAGGAEGPRGAGAAMAQVLDAVDGDPATWRMFLVAPQVGPPALADNLAAGRALLRSRYEDMIGSRSGALGADPELTARLMLSMADEMVRLRLADPTLYTTERLLAQVDWLTDTLVGPSADTEGRSR